MSNSNIKDDQQMSGDKDKRSKDQPAPDTAGRRQQSGGQHNTPGEQHGGQQGGQQGGQRDDRNDPSKDQSGKGQR